MSNTTKPTTPVKPTAPVKPVGKVITGYGGGSVKVSKRGRG